MPRKRPEIGSVFTIPLLDGGFAIGQVLAHERKMLNSITCLFTSLRDWDASIEIESKDVISCQFTTHDLLSKGRWKIVGQARINLRPRDYPFERFRKKGWVGAKMIGSKNIEELLNAWHGLSVWDDWFEPDYLDNLLFRGCSRPSVVLLKSDVERGS